MKKLLLLSLLMTSCFGEKVEVGQCFRHSWDDDHDKYTETWESPLKYKCQLHNRYLIQILQVGVHKARFKYILKEGCKVESLIDYKKDESQEEFKRFDVNYSPLRNYGQFYVVKYIQVPCPKL